MFIPVGDTFVNVLNVAFVRPDTATTKGTETDTSGHANPVDIEAPVVDMFMVGGGDGVRVENQSAEDVAKVLNAGIMKLIELLAAAIVRQQAGGIRPEDMPDGG